MLKQSANFPLLVDDDWYRRYCENYTHVTPTTRPGAHGLGGRDWIGPVFQPNGASELIAELASTVAPVALMICAFFKFEDLTQEMQELIEGELPQNG